LTDSSLHAIQASDKVATTTTLSFAAPHST
jgi:hypothetical protein